MAEKPHGCVHTATQVMTDAQITPLLPLVGKLVITVHLLFVNKTFNLNLHLCKIFTKTLFLFCSKLHLCCSYIDF